MGILVDEETHKAAFEKVKKEVTFIPLIRCHRKAITLYGVCLCFGGRVMIGRDERERERKERNNGEQLMGRQQESGNGETSKKMNECNRNPHVPKVR